MISIKITKDQIRNFPAGSNYTLWFMKSGFWFFLRKINTHPQVKKKERGYRILSRKVCPFPTRLKLFVRLKIKS